MSGVSSKEALETAWISPQPRKAGAADLHLLGCGTDYKSCMADYTSVAGAIAMPPLFGVGVWWSRHWGDESGNKQMVDAIGPMSEKIVMKDVVDGYRSRDLPLNVLVMDMEWHEMLGPPTCKDFKGKSEWGGYTWNSTLFPDPEAFVQKLHSVGEVGTQVSLNFHPDSGVDVCQANHAPMAKALGLPADKKIDDIDGKMSLNQTYADAYWKYMIAATFVDVSWTDTPQATSWTNWLYVRYPMLQNKRTINFSRYGGLGNHRTPSGFSGDTARKWDTLEFEVYFTPRASNVGFGWWSHDIGGFSGVYYVDKQWHTEGPELFLRWLQFGALSPILRTHCRYCDQRIWSWAAYDDASITWYEPMRQAMMLRNQLVPYIYSFAALKTYALGQSLLRPMYWEAKVLHIPDADAYSDQMQRQYLFGDELIARPVTAAVSNGTNTTDVSVYLPKSGSWFRLGDMKKPSGSGSGGFTSEAFGREDVPLYVRGGAILPTRDMSSAYSSQADPLIWFVAGIESGENGGESVGTLYEDDGVSMDFRKGVGKSSSVTTLSATHATSSGWSGKISLANASADAAPRSHWLTFGGVSALPTSARCGQLVLKKTAEGAAPGFWLTANASGSGMGAGKGWLVVACCKEALAQGKDIDVSVSMGADIGARIKRKSDDTGAVDGAWKCTTDASCQLNGVCKSGVCACDPQWLGSNCSQLNLGESKAAYQGMTSDTSTWGGHAVYDKTKKIWHLYTAEMSNHCTLSAWTTNSMTVHATSPDIWNTPFVYKNTVQMAWSHNPLVRVSPAGEVLISHIGCGRIPAGAHAANCSKDLSGRTFDSTEMSAAESVRSAQALPPCGCPHPLNGKACQTLQVISSKGFDGPWSDTTLAWPLTNITRWPSSLSNPTMLFPAADDPTGKVLLGFNGNLAPPNNHGPTSHAGLMVSRGADWHGPYDFVNVSDRPEGWHNLDTRGHNEDEDLFRDARGNLHLVSHGFYDLFPGAHGWTTDKTGATGWEFSSLPVYGFNVTMSGKKIKLGQRERPQLVQGETGELLYLFNGARGIKGTPNPQGDTFNMITEICAGLTVGGMCPARKARKLVDKTDDDGELCRRRLNT